MGASFSEEMREELRVAAWWLKLLGHDGYLEFPEKDLYRWYKAMELRGPVEIREQMVERSYRVSAGPMMGIVSFGPHPPRALVEKWLMEFEHRPNYWPVPIVLACGVLLSACFMTLAEHTAAMLQFSRLIYAGRP